MNKKTIRDIELAGKTVIVRTSLNVPIENNQVKDELRLEAALPTLSYLLERNCKLVLISHHSQEGQSLAPVAPVLAKLLGKKVEFLPDSIGTAVKSQVQAMQPGDVLLLENLRFHEQEEANDENFARELAGLGEIYVDDDFTAMHRAHASTVSIPKFLPSVAGLQVEKEVSHLEQVMQNPTRPLLVVVGGAKIATKLPFLNYFLKKADAILIGGAMANTFLAADGYEVGKSKYDKGELELARKIKNQAAAKNMHFFMPLDVVVTADIATGANARTVGIGEVRQDDIIADVGSKTVDQTAALIQQKGTIIWNGPLGITEVQAFGAGSLQLAKLIIDSGATSVIGGGDTIAFVNSVGLADKFSFVSTGGGASLEFLSGEELPGLAALIDKD